MRGQTVIVLMLALGCGGAAAVGVLVLSSTKSQGGEAMDGVVVVAREIPRGETITADAVVLRPYPRDLIPQGVLTKIEDAVGRAALTPLVKDEPLLGTKLAPKGAGRGLASLVKPGMRAITVQTPNVAMGLAGFIVPGNRVDVLLAYTDNGREDQPRGSITLLEDVEILAVDQKVDAPAENKVDAAALKSVTISVSPEQATRLTYGQGRGTISLSLRNSTDHDKKSASVTDLEGRSWGAALKKTLASIGKIPAPKSVPVAKAEPAPKAVPPPPPPPKEPPPAPPPPRTIRTFRGSQEGTLRLGGGAFR